MQIFCHYMDCCPYVADQKCKTKPIYKILAALNDTKNIRNTLILLVFAKFKALIDALEFNDPFRQNVENLCRFFVILWTVVRTSQTKSAKPHFCRQSVHIEMQGKLSVSQLYNLLTFDFILKKICSFGFIQIRYILVAWKMKIACACIKNYDN